MTGRRDWLFKYTDTNARLQDGGSGKHDNTKGTKLTPITNQKEIEIYELPNKEFNIVILNNLCKLPKNTDRSLSKICKTICDQNEKFSTEIENIQKNQIEILVLKTQFSSVQFSRSVMSNSLRPYESQHARLPCPSPTPGVYSDSCPSSRWCHPAISSSVIQLSSCPQSLPASGSFPISQRFAWGGQSIGVSASASVLPMNTQDWSPLGWTDWIFLQSKGLSRISRNSPTPQFKSINSSALNFLHSPTLTSIHDHWKNHSLDQKDLYWQSNVSAF